MSCVTGVTGTTGTTFYTQLKIFNFPEEFRNVVDKAQSESKTKRTGATSGHLQDFMYEISNQPSKWEYLEHFHMTHYFWGKFGTYLGQLANNKTIVKFPGGKKTASKKGVMIRKVSSIDTSTNYVSQSRLSDKSDIILKIFGPEEINQDETK